MARRDPVCCGNHFLVKIISLSRKLSSLVKLKSPSERVKALVIYQMSGDFFNSVVDPTVKGYIVLVINSH